MLTLSFRFQSWPSDALAAVANKFLTEMDLDAETRSKLVKLCQSIHTRITEASEGEILS
jgi:dynein heavy chain